MEEKKEAKEEVKPEAATPQTTPEPPQEKVEEEEDEEFEVEPEPELTKKPFHKRNQVLHQIADMVLDARPYIPYVVCIMMIFLAFGAGKSCGRDSARNELLKGKAPCFLDHLEQEARERSRSQSPSRTPTECELYPEERICKAAAKLGAVLDTDPCFGSPPYDFDLSIDRPSQCSQLGLMGMFDLAQLREGKLGLKPIFQDELPEGIKLGTDKGLDARTVFIAFIIASKANGRDLKELLNDSDMGILFQYHQMTGNQLTDDQRKAIGQMLVYYNMFVKLSESELSATRRRIKEECDGYAIANRTIVPIRCLAIMPSPPPAATTEGDASTPPPASVSPTPFEDPFTSPKPHL